MSVSQKKSIKLYRHGIITKKNFQSRIKPFLTDKSHINRNEIIIKKGNKAIIQGRELSETFNKHYVNFVENISGKKPTHVAHDNNIFDTAQGKNIGIICGSFKYQSYQTRFVIQSFLCGNEIYLITPNGMFKLLKEVDTKEGAGFHIILFKLAKMAAHVLCSPLSKVINNSLLQDNNILSSFTATVQDSYSVNVTQLLRWFVWLI